MPVDVEAMTKRGVVWYTIRDARSSVRVVENRVVNNEKKIARAQFIGGIPPLFGLIVVSRARKGFALLVLFQERKDRSAKAANRGRDR